MKIIKDLLLGSIPLSPDPIANTVIGGIIIAASGYIAFKIVGYIKDALQFLPSPIMSFLNLILTIFIFTINVFICIVAISSFNWMISGGYIVVIIIVIIAFIIILLRDHFWSKSK